MTFRTSVFSISDGLSVSLLNISSEGVVLGRGRLIAPSASLGEVLQAGRLKSRVGKSLTLESLTGRVEVLGPEGLEFSSSHANLSLASHGHLRLHSNTGQIELVSQRVLLRDLPVAKLSSSALGPQPTIHQVIIAIFPILISTMYNMILRRCASAPPAISSSLPPTDLA